jgi:hypothetical protein
MSKEKLKLFRNLGKKLIQSGQKMLRSAFSIDYRIVTSSYLKSILVTQYDIPVSSIYCADKDYWITDIDTIKNIVSYDWISEKKYKNDRWDCDNYADAFSSYMAEIFKLNACGKARNIQLFKNGKNVGYHRANLVIATDNGVIKAYLYEPMTNEFKEIENYRKDPHLGNWDYRLNNFEFN